MRAGAKPKSSSSTKVCEVTRNPLLIVIQTNFNSKFHFGFKVKSSMQRQLNLTEGKDSSLKYLLITSNYPSNPYLVLMIQCERID
jgi:hypothetical protein